MSKKIKFIPKSLKIAGETIEIETYGIEAAGANGIFGAFNALHGTLMICDELSKMSCLNTLIHEIGHAIYFFYGIEDADEEEKTVNQMGVGWAQIWKDNPDLVKFLNYAVK
jgi:hypothetical protein